MTIATLIDKLDTVETVKARIAEILVTEQAAQQVLATAAAKDPRLWALRVFVDRSNPWALLVDTPSMLDSPPIVCVTWNAETFDARASNAIERQKATATFYVDCLGYGVSEVDGAGHLPGDARAAVEAHRAVRLVRNILMAGEHAYLGLRGTVWRRWVSSIQIYQPELDGSIVQQIVGARLNLEVDFSEFSPQVQGEALEEIGVTVKRTETGEVLLSADYTSADFTPP